MLTVQYLKKSFKKSFKKFKKFSGYAYTANSKPRSNEVFRYGFHGLVAISSSTSTFIIATQNKSFGGQTSTESSLIFQFQVRRFLFLVVS